MIPDLHKEKREVQSLAAPNLAAVTYEISTQLPPPTDSATALPPAKYPELDQGESSDAAAAVDAMFRDLESHDFDDQAACYAKRKGRAGAAEACECRAEADAVAYDPSRPEGAFVGRIAQLGNRKTVPSLPNMIAAFTAYLHVVRHPSVRDASATKLCQFIACPPPAFFRMMQDWSIETGLPVPGARPRRLQAAVSRGMCRKHQERRDAAAAFKEAA